VILRGKFNGAKLVTEAMDVRVTAHMVGERSASGEALPEGDVERAEVRMQA
jgi:hypothetical protein